MSSGLWKARQRASASRGPIKHRESAWTLTKKKKLPFDFTSHLCDFAKIAKVLSEPGVVCSPAEAADKDLGLRGTYIYIERERGGRRRGE